MSVELDQAKLKIEILIYKLTEEKNIQLKEMQWQLSESSSAVWEIVVQASDGRRAYQDFSIEQLLNFQNDAQSKNQVTMKVASILLQL